MTLTSLETWLDLITSPPSTLPVPPVSVHTSLSSPPQNSVSLSLFPHSPFVGILLDLQWCGYALSSQPVKTHESRAPPALPTAIPTPPRSALRPRLDELATETIAVAICLSTALIRSECDHSTTQ